MRDGVTIYFIRHGQTDWNAAARYQGQRDIPLNELGRAQAKRNGEVLLEHLGNNPGRYAFVASPLGRAQETMRILRTAMGLPPADYTLDERLKEINYGHWEGQLASEIPAIDPAGLALRKSDPFRWRPRDGESYADLMVRTTEWLESIDRDTVVVSHGGVSRTLRGYVIGLDPRNVLHLEVPQDRILLLRRGEMEWL